MICGLTLGLVLFVCGQTRAATVFSWGLNNLGQCSVPVLAQNPQAVAAGERHGLALLPDGTIAAWGDNTYDQTNVPPAATNTVAMAAGVRHNLALQANGTVLAWGDNTYGQTNVPPAATNIIGIAAGATHSVALRNDGTVLVWGGNDFDETNVPAFSSMPIAVAASYYHTLALLSDGTVVSWGSSDTVPASVTNIAAIAAGFGHDLALCVDGVVLAWGDNTFGQATIPAAATNVVGIAAGFYHSLALRADGSVLAWGASCLSTVVTYTNGLFITNVLSTMTNAFGVTNVPANATNSICLAAASDNSLALQLIGRTLKIITQPASRANHAATSVSFSVLTMSSLPLSFQWQKNGTNLVDGGNLSGSTNNILSLTNISWSDAATYSVIVSNTVDYTTSSNATLTVLPPLGYNQITGQLLGSGDVQLSFVGGAGTNYALEYATSLSPADWLPLATNPADAGGSLFFTNTPDASTNNFWRIRSVP